MLGSRVCWQLLLGWALLLAQPVFGDSGSHSSEQNSVQEAEQSTLGSEEPENSVAEEPENLLPELGEPEDLLPELDEPEKEPMEEELEEKPLSDEELEEMQKEEREWLKQEEEKPCGSWLQYLQAIALGHYNKGKDNYYKHDGDVTLKTKKAIGTIISFKVVLMKTNCTKDQLPKDARDDYMFHMYNRLIPKNCESLKGSEKECTFTLFDNGRARDYRPPQVISEKCRPMHPYEKRPQRHSSIFRS